ncbi:MAG: hypothetical protein GY927_15120 [bacterium]|nr:hypothetical protein [bacterium]
MSENKKKQSVKENHYTHQGLTYGIIYGVSLGLIFSAAADSFAFFPIFTGAGISLGLALGAKKDKEQQES